MRETVSSDGYSSWFECNSLGEKGKLTRRKEKRLIWRKGHMQRERGKKGLFFFQVQDLGGVIGFGKGGRGV
eukprot:889201-Amorphochlora_amoeboformis.AAC.1